MGFLSWMFGDAKASEWEKPEVADNHKLSEKSDWDIAYELGREAAISGNNKGNPFASGRLWCAWKDGWNIAKDEQTIRKLREESKG